MPVLNLGVALNIVIREGDPIARPVLHAAARRDVPGNMTALRVPPEDFARPCGSRLIQLCPAAHHRKLAMIDRT